MIAPSVPAHLGDHQTEVTACRHMGRDARGMRERAMARPTEAQRQARAVLDARARSHADASERVHSSESSVPTNALGRSAASSTRGRAYDPLLTVDQVSDWLGVPKGTLYQWRSRRRGPRAIKIGNGIRYRRSEIENYLDYHTDERPA